MALGTTPMHHALQPSSCRPHRALLLVALSLAAATPGGAAAQSKVAEVTGKIGTRHHTGAIAFSPDGKTLALAGRGDGSVVELWNLETGKARVLRSSFNKENTPCTSVIAFSRDGRCLAVEHQKTGVTVWDLDSGKEQAHVPMPTPKSFVHDLAFTNGHRTLVAILTVPSGKEDRVVNDSLEYRCDHTVIRWDVATDRKEGTFVFDPFLMFRAISPDGRYAVLQHSKGQDIFDLMTDRQVCTIHHVGGFVFSEDGSSLVGIYRDHLSVWEIPSGRQLRRLTFDPPRDGSYTSVGAIALSPDKKLVAVLGFEGKKNLVGLLSSESGVVLDRFECCPFGMIGRTVVFSPDGRMLATDTYAENSRDQSVDPLLKLWRLPASW